MPPHSVVKLSKVQRFTSAHAATVPLEIKRNLPPGSARKGVLPDVPTFGMFVLLFQKLNKSYQRNGLNPDPDNSRMSCCAGTNPVVYAALNSHANYPAASPAWVYAEVRQCNLSVHTAASRHMSQSLFSAASAAACCQRQPWHAAQQPHGCHCVQVFYWYQIQSLGLGGTGATGLPAQPASSSLAKRFPVWILEDPTSTNQTVK